MRPIDEAFNYNDFIADVKEVAERIKNPSDDEAIYKEVRLLINKIMMNRIREIGEFCEEKEIMTRKEIMKIGREEFHARKFDDLTNVLIDLIKRMM